MAQTVKNLPAMWETGVWSLGQEDSLEKGMATHSSILGWRILWTEEPDGLQSMRSQRVGNNSATNTFSRGTVDQIFIDYPRSTCSWQLSHFQEASSILNNSKCRGLSCLGWRPAFHNLYVLVLQLQPLRAQFSGSQLWFQDLQYQLGMCTNWRGWCWVPQSVLGSPPPGDPAAH